MDVFGVRQQLIAGELDKPHYKAATYPEVVALTSLIISPSWCAHGESNDLARVRAFTGQVRAVVTSDYDQASLDCDSDPLRRWLQDRPDLLPPGWRQKNPFPYLRVFETS